MKIKNIIVENFQSYFEKSKFEFKEGVNLILGENGGGKSSLFNAFYWVLFDKVYETDKGWGELDVKFFNARAKKLLKSNESKKLSVTLSIEALNFEDRDSSKEVLYTFYREFKLKKNNDSFEVDDTEGLSIYFLNEFGETIPIDDYDVPRCIEFLLPNAIRDYIWFQGETISDLIDFNNSSTLRNAINKISYFPHYRTISEIVNKVIPNLTKKINAHVRSSSKDNKSLKKIIYDIESNIKTIEKENVKLQNYKNEKEELLQLLSDIKLALTGVSDNQNLSEEMQELNRELKTLVIQAEQKDFDKRNNIINKWILKGINPFIIEAKVRLEEFVEEIRTKSKNDNPLPVEIPGAVYVQQMIDDEMCHICSREAVKGSKAHNAILDRLLSSEDKSKLYREKDKLYRNQESNFISLINIPDDIIHQVNQIDTEIHEFNDTHFKIYDRRQEIIAEKKEILKKANHKLESNLTSSAQNLRNLLAKQENINMDLNNKIREIKKCTNEIIRLKSENLALEKRRDKFKVTTTVIAEENAAPYFNVLNLISKKLEENAKDKLITEIEKKASELLHGYLESSLAFKGYIEIDRETYNVGVIDSDGLSAVLNKGNLTAAKMSVINAILFLSSKKLQKSYPMVSDAPSSVFDSKNTKSYMNKIGVTFPQVIIMTKDIYDMSKDDLKSISNVNRVYRLVNKVIDPNKNKESISNYCTSNGEPII